MSKIRTHYDNLKVARNAPEAVINVAYKALPVKYARGVIALAFVFSAVTLSSSVSSATIDFSQYTNGTPITSINGVNFSLVGGSGNGYTPTVYNGQLYSNPFGAFLYPSANHLIIDFATSVTLNSITVQNAGLYDNILSFYGDGKTLLELINTTQAYGNRYTYVLDLAGVTSIDYSNNQNGRWESIANISYTPSAVPEPNSIALLSSGLLLILFYSIKHKLNFN